MELEPVEISGAWLPHGGFRGAQRELRPLLVVPAGEDALLESTVAVDAPNGLVENAFLILRTSAGRVYARLRVTLEPDGSPSAVCESVTTQPAG